MLSTGCRRTKCAPRGQMGDDRQRRGSIHCRVPPRGSTPGSARIHLYLVQNSGRPGTKQPSSALVRPLEGRRPVGWSSTEQQTPSSKVLNEECCSCYLSSILLSGSSHTAYVERFVCACLHLLSFIPPKETQDIHFSCNAAPIT